MVVYQNMSSQFCKPIKIKKTCCQPIIDHKQREMSGKIADTRQFWKPLLSFSMEIEATLTQKKQTQEIAMSSNFRTCCPSLLLSSLMHQYISFSVQEREVLCLTVVKTLRCLEQPHHPFLVFDAHRLWMLCSPPLLEIQTFYVKEKNIPLQSEHKIQDKSLSKVQRCQ